MLFPLRHRQLLALALLIASLFAQGAIAASGCLMPGSSLSKVVAGVPAAPCDSGKLNPNLCLLHSADQSDNSGAQPAATPAPVVVMHVMPVHPVIALPRQNLPAQVAFTDPPITLRNCCFRI
jgi:hypothetical protein